MKIQDTTLWERKYKERFSKKITFSFRNARFGVLTGHSTEYITSKSINGTWDNRSRHRTHPSKGATLQSMRFPLTLPRRFQNQTVILPKWQLFVRDSQCSNNKLKGSWKEYRNRTKHNFSYQILRTLALTIRKLTPQFHQRHFVKEKL